MEMEFDQSSTVWPSLNKNNPDRVWSFHNVCVTSLRDMHLVQCKFTYDTRFCKHYTSWMSNLRECLKPRHKVWNVHKNGQTRLPWFIASDHSFEIFRLTQFRVHYNPFLSSREIISKLFSIFKTPSTYSKFCELWCFYLGTHVSFRCCLWVTVLEPHDKLSAWHSYCNIFSYILNPSLFVISNNIYNN